LAYAYSLSSLNFLWSTITPINSLADQDWLKRYTRSLSVPYPTKIKGEIEPANPNTTPEMVRQNNGAKKNA
jgi:hypothetical protein